MDECDHGKKLDIGRTLNDGATWNLTGYSTTPDDTLVDLEVTMSVPSVYYASSQLTLKRSLDQGATWTTIVSGLPGTLSPGLIAIAPSNPSILYAGPRDRTFPSSLGAGLFKSINGGDSWTPVNTGVADRAVQAIAVHPTNPDIVYVGVLGGLRKTTDGGATWTDLAWTSRESSQTATAIVIDPRAPQTLYAAGRDFLFGAMIARSTDGGSTWTQLAWPTTSDRWEPTGLAVATNVTATPGSGTCTIGSSAITCTAPPLGANETMNIVVAMTPAEFSFFDAGATVHTDTLDRDTSNNSLSYQPSIVQRSDLTLTFNGPATAQTRDALSYTITVTNAGPSPATDIAVTYQTENGVRPGTFTITSGTCSSSGTNGIQCNIPSLGIGATATLTIDATAESAGVHYMVAGANAHEADPTGNSQTISTNVTDPAPTRSGGGGGGSTSPLLLLGLLTLLSRRGSLRRAVRRHHAADGRAN